MGSWGVVAMVDEPAALLAAFAAYHLQLGAAEVHLCLDQPNAEAHDVLAGLPGVILHEAGEDGWAFRKLGRRLPGMNARQKYHASRVLAQTRQDWILHCDADEFLQPPEDGTISDVLSRVPEEINWVQTGVAERVALRGEPSGDIFAGAFRLPWPEFSEQGRAIYDVATMELLQGGVCGHRIGKAMVRSGRGLFIGVHHGLRNFAGTQRDGAVLRGAGLRVLHFDGLTELHYILKMLRYGLAEREDNPTKHARGRWVQIQAMREDAGAAERVQALARAAKSISRRQAEALAGRGLLQHWQPEIARRAAQVLPQLPDLRPAAFDRALLARETALLATVQHQLGFDPTSLAAK